jgi:hypothetical protein
VTFTKVAVVACLGLLGFVCWLAASGFGAAREGLISLFVLVLLVGGGNLFSGRSGSYGHRRITTLRDPSAPESADVVDGANDDEPAS